MGPKLRNRDLKSLHNFAEQLQCATKILQGGYEREASTTAKMKLIAEQLPDSLINKWADVSYSIREKGQNPGVEDLAKFVKRQAAIKNNPGFAGVVAMPTWETRANKKKPPNRAKVPPDPRQTSSFANYFSAKDSGRRPGTGDGQSKPLLGVQSCLYCSGSHELASCLEFQNKDLQTRWDILKRHGLCHVCMRPGNRRDRCESQGSVHVEMINGTSGFFTTSQEETLETLTKVTKPVNGNNNLRKISQTQGMVNIQALNLGGTVQYATAIEPTKNKIILFNMIPAKISSSDGKLITIEGLLDNGSRGTMISPDVAYELGLKGRKEVVSVGTLLQQEDEEFEVVEFELRSVRGEGKVITVEEGLVSEKFNIEESAFRKKLKSHPHLADIEIPDVKLIKFTVLIGKDVSDAHEVFEVRKSNKPDSQCRLCVAHWVRS